MEQAVAKDAGDLLYTGRSSRVRNARASHWPYPSARWSSTLGAKPRNIVLSCTQGRPTRASY